MNDLTEELEDNKSRIETHQKLLKEAMKRPGVKEAMEVYQASQAATENVLAQERLYGAQSVATSSDCTSQM